MKNKSVSQIVSTLRDASRAYYNGESPIMTDSEFDNLKDELETLDSTNEFLSVVGHAPSDPRLQKVPHTIPMGSLKKINHDTGRQEYNTWIKGILRNDSCPSMLVSDKVDGCSVELVYRDGEFALAITRGDGKLGEDVTHSIKNASGFPKKIKSKMDFCVRAEVIFPLSVWNGKLSHLGSSPRNCAAGTMRRTDAEHSEHLQLVCFDALFEPSVEIFDDQSEKLEYLVLLGFSTVNHRVVGYTEVETFVTQSYNERDQRNYETDGIVVSCNDLKIQRDMGEKDGYPYWARAWKFPNRGDITKIIGVHWEVSANGTLAPVAELNPVTIGGASISNASLHNMDQIEMLDIGIGDTVEIERSGDIIPTILRVVSKSKNSEKIEQAKCPACKSKSVRRGPFLYCSRPELCSGVAKKRIQKYIKKRNIMYFGDSSVDKLVEDGELNDIADLYTLSSNTMISAGIGSKMADKILAEIEKSKDCKLSEFLGSLSIDLLGRSEAQNVVNLGFDTLDKWLEMSVRHLNKAPGFQITKSERIVNSILNNTKIIKKIAKHLRIQEGNIMKQRNGAVTGTLAGLSFCFTGKADRPRAELEQIAENRGGDVASGVSKTLSYLVTNDEDSNSTKSKKARTFGVKIISELEFIKKAGV